MKNKNIVRLAVEIDKLKQYCIKHFPELASHAEFSAAITHLLQSPECNIPFIDGDVKSDLLAYLQANIEPSGLSDLEVNEGKSEYLPVQQNFDFLYENIPFPPPVDYKFSFVDLFAGIGGFRQAMQSLGGKCFFSSEWDQFSKKSYEANYGEIPYGDITKIDEKLIPDHDVLCAGFPCQAFSIAGKRRGFEETRGTLFFDVARIIKEKQPKAFFLENVKGIKSHNKGQTLKEILKVLRGVEEDGYLNYYVPDPQIINAKDFGVPQNRERIFIVGFRKDVLKEGFEYPEPLDIKVTVEDILEKEVVSAKYYLSTTYLQTLKDHKARHAGKGNGFGYEIIDPKGTSNAIVCGGMGRERNLIEDHKITDYTPVTNIKGEVSRENIRRMTPREWARLQGYPDNFIIPVSDAQAFKQFGNSVAVPAIKAVATRLIEGLGIK